MSGAEPLTAVSLWLRLWPVHEQLRIVFDHDRIAGLPQAPHVLRFPVDGEHHRFATGGGKRRREHRNPVCLHGHRHTALLQPQDDAGGQRPCVLIDANKRSHDAFAVEVGLELFRNRRNGF